MLRHKSRELSLARALYLLSEGLPFRSGVYAAVIQPDMQDQKCIERWMQAGWWTTADHWADGAFTPQGIAHFRLVFHQHISTIDTVT